MAAAFLVHTRLSWGKTCDYLIANDVEPGLMHRYEKNVQRTRSQFIMATIWKKQSALKNYNFLHHDYDKWTQKQIWADIDYWCNSKKHPIIDLITKWRCTRQHQRLRAEEK